jgi:FtsH-binding integral membrane protein
MGFSYAPTAQAARISTGVERATLVRRTYGLVFLGILVTMLGTAFAMSQPQLFGAVARHPIITMLCAFIPLFMVMRAPRAFPQNIVLTLLFTFIEGIWLSVPMLMYERMQPGIVGQAGLLTFATFGALTMYAVFSRRDFSAWGQFFRIGLWVVLATMILNMFFQNQTAHLWISAGVLLVFSGLLVFDTWRIVRSGTYGPDDYVPAAVQIYLDLINIFLAILSLLGGNRR